MRKSPADVLAAVDRIITAPETRIAASISTICAELLALGEVILEHWIVARAVVPTRKTVEGFRLLALHRQGTRGDPSFNACRETCREIVYRVNLASSSRDPGDAARAVRLGAMVVRHLALFVYGKLEVAGLGEFCCSSRSLHARPSESSLAPPNR